MDKELDSDFENDEGDEDGPTLVTIDDGKGGIKHIKVIQKVDNTTLSRKFVFRLNSQWTANLKLYKMYQKRLQVMKDRCKNSPLLAQKHQNLDWET